MDKTNLKTIELYTHTKKLSCGLIQTKYTVFGETATGGLFSQKITKEEYEKYLAQLQKESDEVVENIRNEISEESIEE